MRKSWREGRLFMICIRMLVVMLVFLLGSWFGTAESAKRKMQAVKVKDARELEKIQRLNDEDIDRRNRQDIEWHKKRETAYHNQRAAWMRNQKCIHDDRKTYQLW